MWSNILFENQMLKENLLKIWLPLELLGFSALYMSFFDSRWINFSQSYFLRFLLFLSFIFCSSICFLVPHLQFCVACNQPFPIHPINFVTCYPFKSFFSPCLYSSLWIFSQLSQCHFWEINKYQVQHDSALLHGLPKSVIRKEVPIFQFWCEAVFCRVYKSVIMMLQRSWLMWCGARLRNAKNACVSCCIGHSDLVMLKIGSQQIRHSQQESLAVPIRVKKDERVQGWWGSYFVKGMIHSL